MPAVGDDEDGIVCWMTPDGNIVCERVLLTADCPPLAMSIAASDSASGDAKSGSPTKGAESERFVFPESWGPNKKELACRILEALNDSTMPDDSIPRRAGEIVDTVQRLLAPVPPSIMLYNYSTQPADVLGAYYLNKGELVKMQQIFKIFEHPKKP